MKQLSVFLCITNKHSDIPKYSCLENPMDRGAWQATVHGVTKIWIGLRD